jgi:hypothetical protein
MGLRRVGGKTMEVLIWLGGGGFLTFEEAATKRVMLEASQEVEWKATTQ